MTLNPICDNVETKQGVPLTVTGVAQVKIMKDQALLKIAAEQFLGKKEDEIVDTILQTLEGHLRAILGTLTVEEVYMDRDQFAGLVREIASPDVGRMGIEILSFTIKDVYDNVEYLASLGKTQTAAVKRDAEIGVAQANRDAGIREAECEKSAMDIKYSTDTKIEDNSRGFKLQKSIFCPYLIKKVLDLEYLEMKLDHVVTGDEKTITISLNYMDMMLVTKMKPSMIEYEVLVGQVSHLKLDYVVTGD